MRKARSRRLLAVLLLAPMLGAACHSLSPAASPVPVAADPDPDPDAA
jgi:hypothetical protein